MDDILRNLNQLREKIYLGGGEERIAKQHKLGKLTARERIDLLLDQDSFVEIDAFASEEYSIEKQMIELSYPGEGVVTGFGKVNGRLVYVFSHDFTVQGGTLGAAHSRKICKIMDLALKAGAPIIGINDSGGARIQEGVFALNAFGEVFYRNVLCSGVIPQISIMVGPCAGGAVYSSALTDFIFMVDGISRMFITGPQVVKSLTGEEVSSEILGGADTHNKISGCAHFLSLNETQCMEQVKKLLVFLPQKYLNSIPEENAGRVIEPKNTHELMSIVPVDSTQVYDIRDVITRLIDNNDFFEVQEYFSPNIVIGFAKLNGKSVGVFANQPMVGAGAIDCDASDKAARFIRFCDSFNIPLITIVDVPGFLPGKVQEHMGIIRHGAKLLYAYAEATVPKISIILRKAYGGAYVAMGGRSLGADAVFAWPSAEIAVMGPEGAINILYRDLTVQSNNKEPELAGRIVDYRTKYTNPYIAAAGGVIDDIIHPQETRKKIIQVLDSLVNKREKRPEKKHGNMPL